jgi:hypothetical protein
MRKPRNKKTNPDRMRSEYDLRESVRGERASRYAPEEHTGTPESRALTRILALRSFNRAVKPLMSGCKECTAEAVLHPKSRTRLNLRNPLA